VWRILRTNNIVDLVPRSKTVHPFLNEGKTQRNFAIQVAPVALFDLLHLTDELATKFWDTDPARAAIELGDRGRTMVKAVYLNRTI
jgi:hypothetical protein